jgi:hypothetical protein
MAFRLPSVWEWRCEVCCACADEAAAEVAERKASDELEHVHTIRLSAKARSFDWASYRPAALGQHV